MSSSSVGLGAIIFGTISVVTHKSKKTMAQILLLKYYLQVVQHTQSKDVAVTTVRGNNLVNLEKWILVS